MDWNPAILTLFCLGFSRVSEPGGGAKSIQALAIKLSTFLARH